jgi:DNA-binding HxlR family transcriptional regulator
MQKRDSRDIIPNPYPILHELGRFRGTLEALVFLYYEESATKYLMRHRLMTRQIALDGALSNLVRHNLAKCDRTATFPYSQTYRLTERGKALAEAPLLVWSNVLVE